MTFSHYYNLLKIFFEKVKSFFYSSDFSYLNLFNYFRKSQSILCSVIFQCSLLIGLFSVVILVLDIIKKFWIFFIKFSWKSFLREKGLFLLWKNITKWLVISHSLPKNSSQVIVKWSVDLFETSTQPLKIKILNILCRF